MKRTIAAMRAMLDMMRRHGRLATTAGVGIIAARVARVRLARQAELVFPDPGPLVAQTTVSVHNAAKGVVIAAIRSADTPDLALVEDAVRQAVAESSGAGADVLAATIGAVEGAAETARVLGAEPRAVAARAAAVAVDAAAQQGDTAADRVREALHQHLRSS